MRNELLFGLASCLLAQAAMAQTPVKQLSQIEAETAVLKARHRKLEVQAQIAAKEAEIAQRNADTQRAAQTPSPQAPMLRGVEGVGGKLFATVEMPGYGLVDVGKGDKLPDGSKVLDVKVNEIVINAAGRHRMTLGIVPVSVAAPVLALDGGGYAPLPAPLPELPPVRGVKR
jgi:type IV pilus biogenesis protein PilP